MAGFKTMVGGEIVSYTTMMDDARGEAVDRLAADAEKRGANAVSNISVHHVRDHGRRVRNPVVRHGGGRGALVDARPWRPAGGLSLR